MTTGTSSPAEVMTFDLISPTPHDNTDITTMGMTTIEISARRSQSESRSFFKVTVKMFFQFTAGSSAEFLHADDPHEDLLHAPLAVARAEGAASLKRLPHRRA